MKRIGKKGSEKVLGVSIEFLVAIGIMVIVIFGIFVGIPRAVKIFKAGIEPSCAELGGECSETECKEYVEQNREKGAFSCENVEYCCVKEG